MQWVKEKESKKQIPLGQEICRIKEYRNKRKH
jgi:hypothetical protein